MFPLLRVALAVAALGHTPTAADDPPRDVVLAATRAVQTDRAAAAAAAWRDRLARTPGDRGALLGLATLARLGYDFPRADSLYDRLLPGAGATPDGFAAYAALGRAQELQGRGMVGAAVPWYERAATLARAAHERDAAVEAALGIAAMRGRAQGTAVELRMLDSIEPTIPDGEPRLVAAFHCERAFLSARTGGRDARATARAGAELARRAGDLLLEARCLHAEAVDFVREGDLGGAGEVLARVESLLRRARDRGGLGAILQWHGYLLVSEGKYGLAQSLLREAAAEGARSGNLSARAWSLLDLSQIAIGVNDLPSARAEAWEASTLFESLGDRWGLATALGFQGQIALDVGDTARARASYRRLLDWAAREHQPLAQGDAHHGLADLAARAHDWPTARRELDAERAALRAAGGTGWEHALAYYDATLAIGRHQYARADRLLRAGLAALDSSQHARRYLARARLAEVSLDRGDTLGAERELREASAELDSWRATLGDRALRLLAFQVRDAFGGRGPGVARVLAGIAAAGHVDAAFDLAEHRRARELRDELARAAALRGDARASGAIPVPAAPDVTIADVQRTLPDPATAVLEYVAGHGQPTTLFVITRAGASAYRLPPVDALRPVIARLVALVEEGGDPRPLARSLGDALLRPALAALPPSITRLVIVPDAALYRVPFQLLVLPDGRWAVQRFAFADAPSAAVASALWLRPEPSGPARLLAFGDPTFGGDADASPGSALIRSAFAAAGGLARLPASADEVRAVARFSPDPVIRLRANASEAFLERATLTGYRVIHFATHAVVDERGSAGTALALAPGAGEDGFVSPGDLAALHLDADVVTLSACRTAGGEVLGGEGLRGLTAPLLQAGARAVVATNWAVGDRSARRMVVDFYDGLADGLGTADALRRASLGAMAAGAPPREWAAFSLVGDPVARVPLRRPPALFRWLRLP